MTRTMINRSHIQPTPPHPARRTYGNGPEFGLWLGSTQHNAGTEHI